MTAFLLIAAVVAGSLVQMYLTYRQSMAFNKQVMSLRHHGTVSVGVAGKRYRGGRAYVALAIDERGVVRDALTLSGWTTFSRARKLTGPVGLRTSRLMSQATVPGLSKQQHEAAQQAIEFAKTRVPV